MPADSQRYAVTLTQWAYVSPRAGASANGQATAVARCPAGFALAGCGCYGPDGGSGTGD